MGVRSGRQRQRLRDSSELAEKGKDPEIRETSADRSD